MIAPAPYHTLRRLQITERRIDPLRAPMVSDERKLSALWETILSNPDLTNVSVIDADGHARDRDGILFAQ